MKFQYDAMQPQQMQAIDAVVDVFAGQPYNDGSWLPLSQQQLVRPGYDASLDLRLKVGAIGNTLLLDNSTILENLRHVQSRSGLAMSDALVSPFSIDVEMETGTGKTYVYLRTIFELNKRYGWTKFIILVPSVAIREGVSSSIDTMREHFNSLYATPFDYIVYSGGTAEQVPSFAINTTMQIMVMTIASIKGDANTRIAYSSPDWAQGMHVIDYLTATQPIVIMDEPQNMESELSRSAIGDLSPLFTLRYSATFRTRAHVVYKLDAIDAAMQHLVKQIHVADAHLSGISTDAYAALKKVTRTPWKAKVEAMKRAKGGSLAKTIFTLAPGSDLAQLTNNSIYEGWVVDKISLLPESVSFQNGIVLQLGEVIGGHSDDLARAMIRETICEHVRNQSIFTRYNIKVLSLFFVDRVSSYREYDSGGYSDGKFARWFDEIFIALRDHDTEMKHLGMAELLPKAPSFYRAAYFASMRKGKTTEFIDSRERDTKANDDAYSLIMKDKARLLSFDEPVRFIFSHSALREGWDNPNVFQICVLREVGSPLARRQIVGRGLRLPVDQSGRRIADNDDLRHLLVVSDESYASFAENLQREYEAVGIPVGRVTAASFADLLVEFDGMAVPLGLENSGDIFRYLINQGLLRTNGYPTDQWRPYEANFQLNVPGTIVHPSENDLIERINNLTQPVVKPVIRRQKVTFNKQLSLDPSFANFWNQISQRTTYRVSLNTDQLIADCCEEIEKQINSLGRIPCLRIDISRADIVITRRSVTAQEESVRVGDLKESFPLPDIVTELVSGTQLTRTTVASILRDTVVDPPLLEQFRDNPQATLDLLHTSIKRVLSRAVIDGVQYEKINGQVYELRELQLDGQMEQELLSDHIYRVQHQDKTLWNLVSLDSVLETSPEKRFASYLDSQDEVRFFVKLPPKFRVPTPVGSYNPDWAICKKEKNGNDKLYLVRETKSTDGDMNLRGNESAKITCARKHFKKIGVSYEVSTPANWNV